MNSIASGYGIDILPLAWRSLMMGASAKTLSPSVAAMTARASVSPDHADGPACEVQFRQAGSAS